MKTQYFIVISVHSHQSLAIENHIEIVHLNSQNLIKSEVKNCEIQQNNEDFIEIECDDSIVGYIFEEETNTLNTANYFQNDKKNFISIYEQIMKTNLNFYSCDGCSKTFLTKYELKEHEKITHNPHFVCEECHFIFTKQAKLKYHANLFIKE